MRVLYTIINHTDDNPRTIVGVPDTRYIGILSRFPVGLPRVVEMPLVIEVLVIGLESR